MITEDYVSFETAQLLKEKGFDEFTKICYTKDKELWKVDAEIDIKNLNLIQRPTFQMAMKWLREVYGIFIEIFIPIDSEYDETIYHDTFSFAVFNLNTKMHLYVKDETEYSTHEEAVEASIKYCLNNFI